jgi:hypothetical protein
MGWGLSVWLSLGTPIINKKGQVGIRAPDPFGKESEGCFLFVLDHPHKRYRKSSHDHHS